MREDAPEVRRLVTTSWTSALPDVNLWTPLLNCVGEKNATCPHAVPRAKYDRLWWYQSCMSHGCSNDGRPVLDPAFHERVREGYLRLAAAEPRRWVVI